MDGTRLVHNVAEDCKGRGAFFTPSELAKFIVNWAVRSPSDRILEPSCGEAAFLLPAAKHLRSLGAVGDLSNSIHGIDIHKKSVEQARRLLASDRVSPQLTTTDFFKFTPTAGQLFDVVIGNPPYVRYQDFAGDARTRALEAALRQGVRLTGLASSWAAFTVHASSFLEPEGRLGLVLPAELLSVNYAAEIRSFLLKRFRSVRLVLFEDLVFPGVLEEVVLLLAEGKGSADYFEVFQARNTSDLQRIVETAWTGYTPKKDEKWTPALLTGGALELYRQSTQGTGFEVLQNWGETYLGAVTGNNDYFTLTLGQLQKLKLPSNETQRISPPGSRHLRGLFFSDKGWEQLAQSGSSCFLFAPSDKPSTTAIRYIAAGEKAGVHKAYKCKKRTPWWRVPLVRKPDLLFTYMNQDRPRIIRNGASVHLLNSLYGIKLAPERKQIGHQLLPLVSLNSVTLLGAEIVGRSYGGGMLKHEPKEADVLPVPSFEVLNDIQERLMLLQPQIASLLRRQDITPAIDIVDRIILKDRLGMSAVQIETLRNARRTLLQRRMTRSRGTCGEN